MSNFSSNQIKSFKREATALKKQLSISQSESLNFRAKREGYSNWPTLMKAFNNQIPSTYSNFNAQDLLEICLDFIQNLNDAQVFTLCWNGSLWIDREDFLSDQVTVESLDAMGSVGDSAIRQYAAGLGSILLTSFDGIADQFILEDDEDDFGNQLVPSHDQVIYTPVVGRQVLINCLSDSLGADFDSLVARLDPVPIDD